MYKNTKPSIRKVISTDLEFLVKTNNKLLKIREQNLTIQQFIDDVNKKRKEEKRKKKKIATKKFIRNYLEVEKQKRKERELLEKEYKKYKRKERLSFVDRIIKQRRQGLLITK